MVDYSSQYAPILERAVRAYNALIELYTPDRHAENDFADHTISETITKRNGLLERLADPATLEEAFTDNYFLSIMKFLDSHWDDYREYPIADAKKFERREALHAELKDIMNEIIFIQNKLEGVQ